MYRTVMYQAVMPQKQYCAIGSVKGNIGHTVAAAGVAGLIKVAMSLHDQQIPGTLHFEKPNPQIDIENSPFYVCDSLTPWKRGERTSSRRSELVWRWRNERSYFA